MIKLSLKGFRSKIDINSDYGEVTTVFGVLGSSAIDPENLEFSYSKGGLETLELFLDGDTFRILIRNATGIDDIFKVKLNLKYTTPNENIIEDSYETSLVIAPGNQAAGKRGPSSK